MASSNGISSLFTAVNTIAQRTTSAAAGSPREWQLSAENRSLSARNHRLQSKNARLQEQQQSLERKNRDLKQQVSHLHQSLTKARNTQPASQGPGANLNVYA